MQECRAGGREFQILGDATEKLRATNDVRANGTVSILVSMQIQLESILKLG